MQNIKRNKYAIGRVCIWILGKLEEIDIKIILNYILSFIRIWKFLYILKI